MEPRTPPQIEKKIRSKYWRGGGGGAGDLDFERRAFLRC